MDLKNYQELVITQEDQEFINTGITVLQKVIKQKGLDKEGRIRARVLDELYPHLKKGTFWSRKKKYYAVMLLGLGLGYCFINELGFKWIYVKDNLGEELAVKHVDSNWVSFPFSSVRKRIGTSEKNFFTAIIESFQKEVEGK